MTSRLQDFKPLNTKIWSVLHGVQVDDCSKKISPGVPEIYYIHKNRVDLRSQRPRPSKRIKFILECICAHSEEIPSRKWQHMAVIRMGLTWGHCDLHLWPTKCNQRWDLCQILNKVSHGLRAIWLHKHWNNEREVTVTFWPASCIQFTLESKCQIWRNAPWTAPEVSCSPWDKHDVTMALTLEIFWIFATLLKKIPLNASLWYRVQINQTGGGWRWPWTLSSSLNRSEHLCQFLKNSIQAFLRCCVHTIGMYDQEDRRTDMISDIINTLKYTTNDSPPSDQSSELGV